MPQPGMTSYRPIRVIGLLMILQVIGLVVIGAAEIASLDWTKIDFQRSESPEVRVTVEPETEQEVEAVAFVLLFLPPAVLMLVAGLSFLLTKRRGWLLSAIAQGLSLAVCLWLYTGSNPRYVYLIMAYCILMILYLNSRDVRIVFHSKRDPTEGPAEAKDAG